MAERVLITGGAGFVGSHLADALASTGHDAIQVVMFDGSVRTISGNVSPTGVWWPLLTPDGGDIPGNF